MLHTKDKLSKDAYTCIILVATDMKKQGFHYSKAKKLL